MNRNVFFILAILLGMAAKSVRAGEPLSLAGQWRFALDRSDVGTNESWFNQTLPDKIQLPGILEAQGYGDAISTSTPWVLSLYDHFWYLRADYAAYTNAENVKVPFLCQPPRHYVGAAWYQRDIEIPANWGGKRAVLFLERPHWKSTVWLDDREIGSDISLCTPHEYDFGMVQPGKHHLTIRVDNRMILPYRADAHSVSDSLDDAWNGIIGKIELRATPAVWINTVQTFANAKSNSVLVKIRIGNSTGNSGSGLLSYTCGTAISAETRAGIDEFVRGGKKELAWNTNGMTFDLELPAEIINPGKLKWDEFHPNLRALHLKLGAGSTEDSREIIFGFRDFHTDTNQFILNDHTIYFRGTHFGGDFPLTGYPPTDVEAWTKMFQTCKNYGLNHMRFHSWCPPEAAFEAADQLGFYLQVECGMWNEISPGSRMEAMLYDETDRILRDFGNHPSLMMISAMNEAHGNWQPVLAKWVKHFRAEDPRHLYTPDTGWSLINSPDESLNSGADYLAVGRIGTGGVRGIRGWFGGDYGDAITGVSVPVIGHEVGQWCAYPDFDVIKKFTGFMQPGNFEIFRNSAAAHGLLEQNKHFAWASGRFQLECYKEEIEANLRTPGMGGFQLLDLHDYTGQGTALVGLLDPFWESKGYATPDEFNYFCRAVVPLARLDKRVFTMTDNFQVPVEIANFGASPLTNLTARWDVTDISGRSYGNGEFPRQTIPLGKNFPLGRISLDLSKFPAPREFILDVWATPNPKDDSQAARLMASQSVALFQNAWRFWLYPERISDAIPRGISVTSSWDDAEKKLSAGENLLFIPRNSDLDWNSPPLARVPVFWNALMGPNWSRMLGLWCDTNSPALAEFPTAPNCDWQWTELLRNTRAINLDHLPRSLTPIVSAIDDWNRNYKLGLIFEARVGAGKLLACSAGLNNDSSPVIRQLRRSLLDYMAGDKFQPKTEISIAEFENLHFDNRIMHKLGATATADGRPAREIVDGDPNTFWSSADARGNGPKSPHEIQISFRAPVAMSGLVLMPRQNQREHQGDIREFRLEMSDDATNWQQITNGQLASTFDEQKILFGKMVTAKYLKLTGISGFGNDHSAALAELAVIYAGPKLTEENPGNLEFKNVRTASPDIDAGDAADGGKKKPLQ